MELLIIESEEFKKIISLFENNKKLFETKKKKLSAVNFSKINWSETFLDFSPYESILNQLKKTKIYEVEKYLQ